MFGMRHIRHPLACAATLCAVTGAVAAAPALAASQPSGGAGFGAIAPSSSTAAVPPPPSRHSKGKWLSRVAVTEYWPAPERWFTGRAVAAPGLPGKHRIDWLYSATGVSMEGEGIGLDGQLVHIDALGSGGWVTAAGKPTDPLAGWSGGTPYWRAGGYWQNRDRAVTFPLAAGGWSNGSGRHYVALPGVSFAKGPSLPLHFLQSIAVDPRTIPLGSRVYIPAYRHDGHGGWFVAQDTGGGITGRHVDVYRAPPPSASDGGQYLTGQRIYVIKPH
jgi:3D (Asp-Asp-Asp) domain-containing protein